MTGQDEKTVDKNLRNKFDKLAERKFSQTVCYEFFGSLNQWEIQRLIKLLKNDDFANLPSQTRDLIMVYLQKLSDQLIVK